MKNTQEELTSAFSSKKKWNKHDWVPINHFIKAVMPCHWLSFYVLTSFRGKNGKTKSTAYTRPSSTYCFYDDLNRIFNVHTWPWCACHLPICFQFLIVNWCCPNWIKRMEWNGTSDRIYVLWKWFNIRLIAFWSFSNREKMFGMLLNFQCTWLRALTIIVIIIVVVLINADIGARAHAQTHAPWQTMQSVSQHPQCIFYVVRCKFGIPNSNSLCVLALDILILGQRIIAKLPFILNACVRRPMRFTLEFIALAPK